MRKLTGFRREGGKEASSGLNASYVPLQCRCGWSNGALSLEMFDVRLEMYLSVSVAEGITQASEKRMKGYRSGRRANETIRMVRRYSSLPEKVLFANPALYKLKCFIIETVIWKWILCGIFRLMPRPLTDAEELFRGLRVLMAACGPGDVSTGPSVDSAAEVLAFDVSPTFAKACHQNRPTWNVSVADVLKLPFPDGEFDISVIYSSLHHIPNSAELVLAELARVTRSRIVLLEGVVPEKGLLRHILLLWYAVMDGGVHYYTRNELLDIAGRLGLEVERDTQHGPIGHMMFAVFRVRRPAKPAIRPARASS